MHIYIHRIMVTVATVECSPDKIERQIEEALSNRENSVHAETERENRMHSPSVTIPDPPTWPTSGRKTDELAYFAAYDTWRDECFPRVNSLAAQNQSEALSDTLAALRQWKELADYWYSEDLLEHLGGNIIKKLAHETDAAIAKAEGRS